MRGRRRGQPRCWEEAACMQCLRDLEVDLVLPRQNLTGCNCAGPAWNHGPGSMVSKAKRWKPQMTRAKAYRVLAERLHAYAQKPEAADYVAEFKQLAKCYRLLAESAERKAQSQNDPLLSKRRLH